MAYTSGDAADADAAAAAFAALKGPEPAAMTLTGAERGYALDMIDRAMAAHERAARTSKIRHEQTVHREAHTGLATVRRMLAIVPATSSTLAPSAPEPRATGLSPAPAGGRPGREAQS